MGFPRRAMSAFTFTFYETCRLYIYAFNYWVFNRTVCDRRTRHLRLWRRPTRWLIHNLAALSGNFDLWPRTTPTLPSTSSHSWSVTATDRRSQRGGRWLSVRQSSNGWTTTCAVGRRRWGTWQSGRYGLVSAKDAVVTSCTLYDNCVFRPGSTISFLLLIRSEIWSYPLLSRSVTVYYCQLCASVVVILWPAQFKYNATWAPAENFTDVGQTFHSHASKIHLIITLSRQLNFTLSC